MFDLALRRLFEFALRIAPRSAHGRSMLELLQISSRIVGGFEALRIQFALHLDRHERRFNWKDAESAFEHHWRDHSAIADSNIDLVGGVTVRGDDLAACWNEFMR